VIPLIEGIFEALMLMCFALAWPFSIYRSWKSGTTRGKSLFFMFIVLLGYMFGMLNKIVLDDVNYVMLFYIMDTLLVLTDMALYFKNLHKERQEGHSDSLML